MASGFGVAAAGGDIFLRPKSAGVGVGSSVTDAVLISRCRDGGGDAGMALAAGAEDALGGIAVSDGISWTATLAVGAVGDSLEAGLDGIGASGSVSWTATLAIGAAGATFGVGVYGITVSGGISLIAGGVVGVP